MPTASRSSESIGYRPLPSRMKTTGASGIPGSGSSASGVPAGYEFISLVQAILLVGGAGSILSADNRANVEAVGHPMVMRVFTTPT
jgi:hypothetical protein